MSHRTIHTALLLSALAAAPAAAQPGGTIQSLRPSPVATFSINGSPTSETDAFHPLVSLSTFYTGGPVSQLQFLWPFYRVAGDSVQRPFGNYTKSDGFAVSGSSSWPSSQSPNPSTANYTWTDFGPNGPRFTANETMTITSGPTDYDAKLTQSLQITNPGPAPLTIALFEAATPYLGGNVSSLSASGGNGSMSVINSSGYEVNFSAAGATTYQAATDYTLQNLLYGGPAGNLNDTGLPVVNYNASQTGHPIGLAFEWSATIPPGSETFNSTITTAFVPEPGSFALAGAAAIAAAAARRLRRRYGGGPAIQKSQGVGIRLSVGPT